MIVAERVVYLTAILEESMGITVKGYYGSHGQSEEDNQPDIAVCTIEKVPFP